MADAKKGFSFRGALEIVDRSEAIRTAIENAAEGDIILIAGKGHEDYQEINGVKHPFDDKRIAVGFMRTRQDIKAQERLEKQRERELREEQARQWEQRDERRPWE